MSPPVFTDRLMVKAYWCKKMQYDLYVGLGNGIYFLTLQAMIGFTNMLADLTSQFYRDMCPSENKRNKFSNVTKF